MTSEPMTDTAELIARLLNGIGAEFDDELHLSGSEARQIADALSSLVRERDEAWAEFGPVDRKSRSLAEHIKAALDELVAQADEELARATAAEADAARMREALKLPDASRRLLFISDTLSSKGYLNRSDICVAFGVSVPQASADISRWLRGNPGVAEYDKSAKRYVRASLSNTSEGGKGE